MPRSRPISLTDIADDQQLYMYLREYEREIARLREELATLRNSPPNLDDEQIGLIRRQLMHGGRSQLEVDGLLGVLAQRQYPDIPKVTALPDPLATLYGAVILDGGGSTSDTLYVLDRSVNPYVWLDMSVLVAAHATSHETGGSDPLTGNLDANARVGVRVNSGGSTYTRRRINFIKGSNVISLTHADDSGSEEVDLTINLAGDNHTLLSDSAVAFSVSDATPTARPASPISITKTGLWAVTATALWDSNATGFRYVMIRSATGTVEWARATANAISGSKTGVDCTSIMRLTDTTNIDINLYQNSGGNLNVNWAVSAAFLY